MRRNQERSSRSCSSNIDGSSPVGVFRRWRDGSRQNHPLGLPATLVHPEAGIRRDHAAHSSESGGTNRFAVEDLSLYHSGHSRTVVLFQRCPDGFSSPVDPRERQRALRPVHLRRFSLRRTLRRSASHSLAAQGESRARGHRVYEERPRFRGPQELDSAPAPASGGGAERADR